MGHKLLLALTGRNTVSFTEAVAEIIRLADARRNFWNTELPKHYPAYPVISFGDPHPPSPPEDVELRRMFSGLEPEIIYKLVLTMYLGRGDFGARNLERHYADMKTTFPEARIAASQMAGKVPLGDYLRDGLERLNRAGIDLDHASLEPAGSPQ
jgi:hypothetical protein